MEENTFLANLHQEGDRIDELPLGEPEREETVPPSEPPADIKPKEDEPASPAEIKEAGTPKSEESVEQVFASFDKNPRWIAREQELKELREFRERAEPLLEKLENPTLEKKVEKSRWLNTAFGDNEEIQSLYQEEARESETRIRDSVIAGIRVEEQKKVVERKKQDEWVENEVVKLQVEGLKFDRNELLKTALEFLPTDEEGNISLRKAHTILQATKSSPPVQPNKAVEEKKRVADSTIKKSAGEEEKKDFKTSADFQGKSIHDLGRT